VHSRNKTGGHRLLNKVITFESVVVVVEHGRRKLNVRYKHMAEKM